MPTWLILIAGVIFLVFCAVASSGGGNWVSGNISPCMHSILHNKRLREIYWEYRDASAEEQEYFEFVFKDKDTVIDIIDHRPEEMKNKDKTDSE